MKMAILYVRIPIDLKEQLDKRAEAGKHSWPPLSLARVTTAVLRAGIESLAAQEAKQPKPRKVRRG